MSTNDKQNDTSDNAGKLSVDVSGGTALGIGSGLTINTSTGEIGIQIAPGISS